jgi:hypothetical protein
MRWLEDWRQERALRTGAERYVAVLGSDPPAEDVEWLATHGTGGDADHARWELRYAKLAIGYLVAQRDALNDRTASAVARALTAALTQDARIDASKVGIAERQLNERLRALTESWNRRDDPIALPGRLARVMLSFASSGARAGEAVRAEAAAILARYLTEAAVSLGEAFGVAELSETIPPSEMHRVRQAG